MNVAGFTFLCTIFCSLLSTCPRHWMKMHRQFHSESSFKEENYNKLHKNTLKQWITMKTVRWQQITKSLNRQHTTQTDTKSLANLIWPMLWGAFKVTGPPEPYYHHPEWWETAFKLCCQGWWVHLLTLLSNTSCNFEAAHCGSKYTEITVKLPFQRLLKCMKS